MTHREHWDRIYATKAEGEASWFEPFPALSLRLIEAAGLPRDAHVLDVGGGDSRLVDALVQRGVRHITVLDLSGNALARARARLGPRAALVTWIEADVTGAWSTGPVDIWHDRAVFHFLTKPHERDRYLAHLRRSVKPGGAVIIATFAPDGPETCSGLPVVRYSPQSLGGELGEEFTLDESLWHEHHTPSGGTQSFQYSRFTRRL